MNFFASPLFARLLWGLPLILVVIAVGTTRAGLEQREIWQQGQTVTAEVTGLNLRERSEITTGQVGLRYTPPGAASPIERQVELPIILLKEIEADLLLVPDGETMELPILVSADSDQIVVGTHPRGTWLLTFSLAGMAAIGALVSALLVGGWNRFLAREGDPGLRGAGVPAV